MALLMILILLIILIYPLMLCHTMGLWHPLLIIDHGQLQLLVLLHGLNQLLVQARRSGCDGSLASSRHLVAWAQSTHGLVARSCQLSQEDMPVSTCLFPRKK